MVNCAHPTHFIDQLDQSAAWIGRIRDVRANHEHVHTVYDRLVASRAT